MLNFTQWLLFQLAGEASELAKEATKGGQFGLGSEHNGVKNIKLIQAEFMDVLGVIEILNFQDDVRELLGEKEYIGISGLDIKGQVRQQSWMKSFKLSYYAMRAIGDDVFMPTWYEFNTIWRCAKEWHDTYAPYANEDERIFMDGFLKGVVLKVRAHHWATGANDEDLTDVDAYAFSDYQPPKEN